MNAARNAYAAYCRAVGGQTFEGKPLPEFDDLGPKQKEGWEAAGKSAGLKHIIGETITTKTGATGTVRSIARSSSGANGYWFEGVDSTGRPFEAYALETDVAEEPAA